jgi:cytochrome c oxidase subunit 2
MSAWQHALQPAGPQAAHIAQLWWLTLILCVVVFAAVMAALGWALWRAPRASPATSAEIATTPIAEARTKWSVIGAVGASLAGLMVLLFASVWTDRALAHLPLGDAINIEVTAHQWWWEVVYDDAEPSRIFSTANEIYIPVGRPVQVTLKSDDVIHSFWVPNLHGKKDLIPGRTATIQLRADQPGTYRGQCAEFCGLQHAFMAFSVKAVAGEVFQQWLEGQRKPAVEPQGEREKRGQALFLSGSCMMCHAIQGTSASAHKAPDLTHLASRETIGAGRLPNTPEQLSAWTADPHQFKPGVNMPAQHIPAADLEALTAYLGTLK